MSTAVPLSALHDTFGTLAVGAYVNTALFTLELTQLYKYHRLFPSDRWPLRVLVIIMFLVDLLSSANACCMVYLYTINHWGDVQFMMDQNFTVPIYSLTIAVSVLSMHSFLIFRYIRLSRNFVIAAFLCIVAVGAFVGDALATWSVISFTRQEERTRLRSYAVVWLTCSAGADGCVSLALIYELMQVQSTFAKTKSLIRRLMRTAAMTGIATATLAILTLATFLAKPTGNYCLMFGMCIGRACTLTVLYNLNMRKTAANYPETSHIGGFTNSLQMDTGINFDTSRGVQSGTAGATTNGINVHQLSVVHMDSKVAERGDEVSIMDDHKSYERKATFTV